MFVVQVQQVRAQSVRRQSRSHSCSLSAFGPGCSLPVVCSDRCWVVQSAENCEGPAVAAHLTRGSMSLLAQFINGSDVPVIMQRRLYSGSASDSVHRRSPWTVQLRNRERYSTFSSGGYGGGEGFFFDAFWRHFSRSSGLSPELSASFRSPRWRRVLWHRGLLHNFMLRVC